MGQFCVHSFLVATVPSLLITLSRLSDQELTRVSLELWFALVSLVSKCGTHCPCSPRSGNRTNVWLVLLTRFFVPYWNVVNYAYIILILNSKISSYSKDTLMPRNPFFPRQDSTLFLLRNRTCDSLPEILESNPRIKIGFVLLDQVFSGSLQMWDVVQKSCWFLEVQADYLRKINQE